MDIFLELIVQKSFSIKDTIISILIGVASSFFAMLFLVLSLNLGPLAGVGLLLSAGCIYFGWRFITARNIEFEYSCTNGEIDIDKIIAKRKRKKLYTLSVRQIEKCVRASENIENTDGYTIVDISDMKRKADRYALYFYNVKGIKTCFYMNLPNRWIEEFLRVNQRAFSNIL